MMHKLAMPNDDFLIEASYALLILWYYCQRISKCGLVSVWLKNVPAHNVSVFILLLLPLIVSSCLRKKVAFWMIVQPLHHMHAFISAVKATLGTPCIDSCQVFLPEAQNLAACFRMLHPIEMIDRGAQYHN